MKDDKKAAIFAGVLLASSLLVRYLNSKAELPEGNISKYYTYYDVIHSSSADKAGIKNVPTPLQLKVAKAFALNYLDPLTDAIGHKIKMDWGSWFRTGELTHFLRTNPHVTGGYEYSDHETGFAADLDSPNNKLNHQIVYWILKLELPFKQLILEKGTKTEPHWVHLAIDPFNQSNNRGEILYYNGSSYSPVTRNSLKSLYGFH